MVRFGGMVGDDEDDAVEKASAQRPAGK